MKIYYLEVDDTLTIFGVVSKKRTGFDGKNVVGIRVYDLPTGNEIKYKDIKDIVNIDVARKFWNGWVDYAVEENHKLIISESTLKKKNGREIMMDSDVNEAMAEIAQNIFVY